MNNFNDFLKGIDNKTLAEGIKRAQEFSKTEEGKKMINRIKSGENVNGIDKIAIEKAFKDNPALMNKINDLLK